MVTELQRFGYHMQPTEFVLTFDSTLNPTSAQDVNNYRIVPLTGSHAGAPIAIAKAVYDATDDTVTLTTVDRVYLYGTYQITVNGTPPSGLTNTSGQFLQGQGSGHPGTNYVQTFGESILAGPNMTSSMSRATRARILKTWRHELAYASRIATRIAKAAHRRTEAGPDGPPRHDRRDGQAGPPGDDRRAGAGRRARLGRTPSAGRPCAGPGRGPRRFALSQAREIAELHEARADGIIALELLQSHVEREQVDVGTLVGDLAEIDLQPMAAAPAFEAALVAGPVEDDPAHGLGRGGEEVPATVPMLNLLGIHEANVRLMDWRVGVENLARFFLR